MAMFIAFMFLVISVLLIIVVLLQKGRGGGLGAALGGMSTSAFGTRTGDVFTWVTVVLVSLFLLLAIGATLLFQPEKQHLPMPTFEPPEGEIDQPQSVMISVGGAKSDEVKIYYTLDGSIPRDSGPQFKGVPIMVQPGTTVTAVAYGAGHLPSPPGKAVYRVKGQKPASSPAAVRGESEIPTFSTPASAPALLTIPTAPPAGAAARSAPAAPALPAATNATTMAASAPAASAPAK